MNNFYTRRVLNDDQLKIVKEVLNNADNHNLWIDGLRTGGGYSRIKNNVELSDLDLALKINQLIMSCLDADNEFVDFTAAKSTNVNIISKTTSGGYYNPHFDNWLNGDYSTTIFLNDPEEYVGGELCLYFGGEEEIKIKLNAGWGITYPTGVLHRVNRVLSGSRYVSVFWTESLLKDSFIRHIYSEIGKIHKNVLECQSSVHLSDCINASKDPVFCLENLKQQILRRYASK